MPSEDLTPAIREILEQTQGTWTMLDHGVDDNKMSWSLESTAMPVDEAVDKLQSLFNTQLKHELDRYAREQVRLAKIEAIAPIAKLLDRENIPYVFEAPKPLHETELAAAHLIEIGPRYTTALYVVGEVRRLTNEALAPKETSDQPTQNKTWNNKEGKFE